MHRRGGGGGRNPGRRRGEGERLLGRRRRHHQLLLPLLVYHQHRLALCGVLDDARRTGPLELLRQGDNVQILLLLVSLVRLMLV